jgi:hypothetical protein
LLFFYVAQYKLPNYCISVKEGTIIFYSKIYAG